MPRRTETITISIEGRDKGKVFVLTEMSATQAEKWATRVFLALGQSGIEVPDDIANAGLAGMATLSMRALVGIPWHLAEPLLDEMMSCVALMPNPARPMTLISGPLLDDQIEEVSTRLKLREEVISLHLGFSLAESISKFRTSVTQTTELTSNTATSLES
jgi:hypothetical protein